jgi:mono/diheme cytochrome c family protein
MRWAVTILATIAVLAGAWYLFQPDAESSGDAPESRGALPEGALVAVRPPADFTEKERTGNRAFDAICAACHGPNAQGRDGVGPPLVHKIYEPSHHGDMAFVLAARNGVRAHHWKFGNMPPVEGVTQADLLAIVAYVRALQRANGIE